MVLQEMYCIIDLIYRDPNLTFLGLFLFLDFLYYNPNQNSNL